MYRRPPTTVGGVKEMPPTGIFVMRRPVTASTSTSPESAFGDREPDPVPDDRR